MTHRIALLASLSLLTAVLLPAAAAGTTETCVLTPTGIECAAGETGTSIVEGDPLPGDHPPLRYLATDGDCWYWTPYPPGYDSQDSAFDHLIINTLFALEACPATVFTPPPISTFEVEARAWEVFRAFPLARPAVRLEPADGGITGLPTFLSVQHPDELDHRETLPDGSVLEVHARIGQVRIDWGDGTRVMALPLGRVAPRPAGAAAHAYALKTCPAAYRSTHPSGGNCHPTLAAYRITASFVWTASYRRGGSWVDLGDLERSATVLYDVDEVVGVLAKVT